MSTAWATVEGARTLRATRPQTAALAILFDQASIATSCASQTCFHTLLLIYILQVLSVHFVGEAQLSRRAHNNPTMSITSPKHINRAQQNYGLPSKS